MTSQNEQLVDINVRKRGISQNTHMAMSNFKPEIGECHFLFHRPTNGDRSKTLSIKENYGKIYFRIWPRAGTEQQL